MPAAHAILKFSGSTGYLASIRSADGQVDFYDGFSYGGRVALAGPANEFFVSYLYSSQVANYVNVDPPNESTDQWFSVGMRRFLVGSQRAFLEFAGLMSNSDSFKRGWVSFRKNGVVLSVSACVDGTFGFTHTENAEGSYDFSFAQTDMAGNESASLPLQWIVESPAPNPPVVLLPEASPYVSNGNAVSISGSCTSGNTIHLEGASVDSMVCADSAFYFTLILGDGIHDFLLSQDNGTKRSTATSFQWIRDTSPPEAIVVSGPSTPWDMSTAEIAFTANETPVSFECRLDAGTFASCESPRSYTGMSLGPHVFQVRAVDASGNVGLTDSYEWSVAPINTIALGPSA